MPKAVLGGIDIELDEDGFIQEPDKWTKVLAEELAKTENAYPMNENHWKLIDFLRDYYLKFGVAPPIRMLVKKTGIDLKQIYELFPGRTGQGRLQGGGSPEADGLRVKSLRRTSRHKSIFVGAE